jgi:glycerol uptake facilitator-like aquaporin
MRQKFFAEFLGTAFLVMIVLGSGVMAKTLFPGQNGLALLANSIATTLGLYALIQTLGTISGSHLNPVVSFVEFLWGRLTKKETLFYFLAQFTGAYLGVIFVHLMFNLPTFVISIIDRSGTHLLFSEVVASFGLICVIALSGKKNFEFAPISVASYVGAGYWFTSSTGFMNPAVTFGRTFTNTFGGMDPNSCFSYFLAQFIGAFMAWLLLRKLN